MGEIPKGQVRGNEPPGGIVFSPLTSAHLGAITEIAKESFAVVWAPKEFSYFLDHSCGLCWGLFSDDTLRSYFLGLLVRGELDIVSIATSAASRRRGLGEQLLRKILTNPDVSRAFLEVNAQNSAAIELYKKCGFEIQGVRKKYYQHKDDALLMRWVRQPG